MTRLSLAGYVKCPGARALCPLLCALCNTFLAQGTRHDFGYAAATATAAAFIVGHQKKKKEKSMSGKSRNFMSIVWAKSV